MDFTRTQCCECRASIAEYALTNEAVENFEFRRVRVGDHESLETQQISNSRDTLDSVKVCQMTEADEV